MASQEEDSENSELSKKLDKFLGEFNAHISKKSNEVGKNMIDFLKDNPDAIVNYTGLTTFIDGLVLNWVNNQNHKVRLKHSHKKISWYSSFKLTTG